MGCGEVIDDAEAELLFYVGCLYACLFAYFAPYGSEWVGVGCHVQIALEEAADDVVASNVDIDSLPLVEQDVVVARFDNRADGEGVSEFLASMPLCKFGNACRHILFITGISHSDLERSIRARCSLHVAEERCVKEALSFLTCLC